MLRTLGCGLFSSTFVSAVSSQSYCLFRHYSLVLHLQILLANPKLKLGKIL